MTDKETGPSAGAKPRTAREDLLWQTILAYGWEDDVRWRKATTLYEILDDLLSGDSFAPLALRQAVKSMGTLDREA